MNLSLIDLLGPLFSAKSTAIGEASPPESSGGFAALLQELQSSNERPQPEPTASASNVDALLTEPLVEVSGDPAMTVDESAETDAGDVVLELPIAEDADNAAGDDKLVTDVGVPTPESHGPPEHRNHPEVALPAPALLHAMHSNGAPFEAFRVASVSEDPSGPSESIQSTPIDAPTASEATSIEPEPDTNPTQAPKVVVAVHVSAPSEAGDSSPVFDLPARAKPASRPVPEVVVELSQSSIPAPATVEVQSKANGVTADRVQMGPPSVVPTGNVGASITSMPVIKLATTPEPNPPPMAPAAAVEDNPEPVDVENRTTAPPPADEGFLPNEAAQHRAIRAVEVLTALKSGLPPPKPAGLVNPQQQSEAEPPVPSASAAPDMPVNEAEPVQETIPPLKPRVVPTASPLASDSPKPPPASPEAAARPLPVQPTTELARAAPAPVLVPPERRAQAPSSATDLPRMAVEPIVQTAIQSVRHVVAAGEQSVVVKLVPESLGELHITVTSRKDSLEIVVAASNQHVRQALEHQMHGLRESLLREGIDVTRATVTVPVAADNDVQTSFSRAGSGHHGGSERSSPHQSFGDSHRREPNMTYRTNRSWIPHEGRLNLFV